MKKSLAIALSMFMFAVGQGVAFDHFDKDKDKEKTLPVTTQDINNHRGSNNPNDIRWDRLNEVDYGAGVIVGVMGLMDGFTAGFTLWKMFLSSQGCIIMPPEVDSFVMTVDPQETPPYGFFPITEQQAFNTYVRLVIYVAFGLYVYGRFQYLRNHRH